MIFIQELFPQGSTRLSGTSECFGRASEKEMYLPNRTSNLKMSIPKTIITAFICDIAFVMCDIVCDNIVIVVLTMCDLTLSSILQETNKTHIAYYLKKSSRLD